MKKIYLLAFVLGAFTFSANAQFNDDMESYDLGPLHEAQWSSWTGVPGAGDIIVSDEYANSGSQSGFVSGDLVQDALLLLDNKTTGAWQVDFKMYIPGGKSGYFNFQGQTEGGGAGGGGNAGVFLSPNLVFNNVQSTSGAPGLAGAYGNVDDPDPLYTWSYPQDFWFDVSIIFDITNISWTMTVDGVEIPTQPMDAAPILGGIDFFSFDANNEYYIDDVVFSDTAGTEDFATDSFSVYPNPVKDILNISTKTAVDNVTVYDVLGKSVLVIQPDVVSPKIDMSGLAAGAYLVKVTIGGTSHTVKVIK
ncbi:T9SS type A sorting domain-containing protein [Aequorivita lipolytica]|uniref:T9SS type A sorting domain-containing protein n=1 Tax=Aequorivita lipolytica TaxID=153267 RepID=A0A5C6YPC7_9FLAO|nr:T9SS type A sorting domain-containing protein [Aequorivita lipolytica]TXD68703.1 T9SS type A sorting domain-containing protein [Aequorivita lipolytica]SRX53155.1 hypothetical protein AEQU2_02383 [Aequorivita lipolytica]